MHMTQPEANSDKLPSTDRDQSEKESKGASNQPQRLGWRRSLLVTLGIILAAVLLTGGYFAYLYASTPPTIRQPLFEHYHFRLSLNVNGKEENFAQTKYQEGYSKDNCNALLTTHPFHFHDSKNHFVHVHWEGMTGGQVLKYYGWNFIGGAADNLGYRFDSFPKLKKVPIFGKILPAIPDGATYYVYTGNAKTYKQRNFQDFTTQDLEKFFNKTSNSPSHQLNQQKRSALLDMLVPKAYAQDNAGATAMPIDHAERTGKSTEELTKINNLIGDVVIFVQNDQPSAKQIKDRFNHLEPLSESTCGG
jgi:hypothetical protein